MKVHRRDIVKRGIFKTKPGLFSSDHFSMIESYTIIIPNLPELCSKPTPNWSKARAEPRLDFFLLFMELTDLHHCTASSANTQHKYKPSNVSQ